MTRGKMTEPTGAQTMNGKCVVFYRLFEIGAKTPAGFVEFLTVPVNTPKDYVRDPDDSITIEAINHVGEKLAQGEAEGTAGDFYWSIDRFTANNQQSTEILIRRFPQT